MITEKEQLCTLIHKLAEAIHESNVEKGFWEDRSGWPELNGSDKLAAQVRMADSEAICLMHSELSEAQEGVRDGDPDSDKIAPFSVVEEELADVIIRILDFGEGRGLSIPEAIFTKLEYNLSRPHKHGRKC